MANGMIRQHQLLAQGKDTDVADGCETCFKGVALHGGTELSKKKHLKDGARGLKHLGRVADHGEHGMNGSIHAQSDDHTAK